MASGDPSQSVAQEQDPKTKNFPANPFPRRLILSIVLLLTFVAFAPTLRYLFVYDDVGQIVQNPAVQSWQHLPQYFTRQVWAGPQPGVSGNYYRPVFLIWLRLNDMVFGLHPWGWHLTTVLMHLLATLLVFFLARRLIHDEFTAAAAAFLFGMHPVHIEAVAWISGVTEPLLAIFFILAFLCYLRARESKEHPGRWRALALLMFALAILEKETAAVFPLVIIAYNWFYDAKDRGTPGGRQWVRRAVEAAKPALPYFALIVPYLAARIHALNGFSHTVTPLPLSTVLLTLPSLLVFWARHFAWPAGLSTFYDLRLVSHPTMVHFVLPALAVFLMAGLAVAAARGSRQVSFTLAWVVLPLLPLLDIRVFGRYDFAHDRYLYLPSIGLAILLALALRWLPSGKCWRGIPTLQAAVLLLLAPLMIYGVQREGAYFASPQTFYAHCAQIAPQNNQAATNYAAELGKQGKYPQAVKLLKDILKRNPGEWMADYNLGLTYYHMGQMGPAEKYLRRAIQLQPGSANQYLYLGLVELRTGRIGKAEESIRSSLYLDPQNFGSHFALGVILKDRGDTAGALREFEAELANYPHEAAPREQIRTLKP